MSDDRNRDDEYKALVKEIRKLVTEEAKRLLDAGVPISEISERSRAIATEKTHAAIARVMGDTLLPEEHERLSKPYSPDRDLDRHVKMPPPGTWIRKIYRGEEVAVKVLEDGFEFEGKPYPTLSSVVTKVTGGKHRISGYVFFRTALEGLRK